jgi:cobalt/nickel transport system permease protein
MIGGFPALLSITAVLIIQCLFFADGGLLALGCNIFNMGVIPCLIIYPMLFKPLLKKGMTLANITAASIFAVVISLQLGAFCVVLETRLSGITELPFGTFLLLMQPIHLAIGVAEGVITSAILCFIYTMRPEIMESACNGAAIQNGIPMKKALITLAVVTLVTGGVFALFASSHPDGLEWSMKKTAGTAELDVKSNMLKGAASIQEATAFLPDYDFKNASEDSSGIGISIAGIVGSLFSFLLAGAAAFAISAVKKRRKENAA